MNIIDISLLSLTASINALNECIKRGTAIRFQYAASSSMLLLDSKGAEKEEAMENYHQLLDMLELLNELMEKTSGVLKTAKQKYIETDESMANKY